MLVSTPLKRAFLTARAIRTLMFAALIIFAALTVSNFTQLPAHLI
jgi:hypothetical protein